MTERRIAGTAALVLLLAGLGVVAAGCGGGSAAPQPTTTSVQVAAFQAYETCLKAHGVTIHVRRFGRPPANRQPPPSGAVTSGSRPRGVFGNLTAKQRKAAQECRSKLPAGGRFRQVAGARNGGFAKYTACLSKHGVKFGAAGQSSSAFRKAQAACSKLLPAAGGAPATTTAG